MKAFLIPKAGVTVKIPGPKPKALPVGGDEVELNTYWYRRLADGDVTRGKSQTEAAAAPAAEAPAAAADAAADAPASDQAKPATTAKSSKSTPRVEQ